MFRHAGEKITNIFVSNDDQLWLGTYLGNAISLFKSFFAPCQLFFCIYIIADGSSPGALVVCKPLVSFLEPLPYRVHTYGSTGHALIFFTLLSSLNWCEFSSIQQSESSRFYS